MPVFVLGAGDWWKQLFLSFIIGPFYYATPENRWFETLQNLPTWMTPALHSDGTYHRQVIEGWYVGLRPGETIPWSAWLVPFAAWGLCALATFFMLGCLSVILRAQWGEREALTFPLLRLPQEMTEDVDRPDKYGVLGRFFRNPLMWCGFAVAVFIQGLNGLHLYYPDVPLVPLEIATWPLFTEAPWNQMGWIVMRVWPVAVGMTYLLSSEVSFSLWFFYWFIKAQLVFAYYLDSRRTLFLRPLNRVARSSLSFRKRVLTSLMSPLRCGWGANI
jgi:hypothetical protein